MFLSLYDTRLRGFQGASIEPMERVIEIVNYLQIEWFDCFVGQMALFFLRSMCGDIFIRTFRVYQCIYRPIRMGYAGWRVYRKNDLSNLTKKSVLLLSTMWGKINRILTRRTDFQLNFTDHFYFFL